MRTRSKSSGRSLAWLAMTLVMALLIPLSASAQKPPPKKGFSVGPFAFKRLTQAQKLMEEGKYNEALKLVSDLRTDKFLNDYERALAWQTTAFIFASQEKYDQAAETLKFCLSMNALPEGAALQTQFTLAQIYLAQEKYDEAIKTLEDWLKKARNPGPKARHILGVAYAQKKLWKTALSHSKAAVNAQAKPPESWLNLYLAIQYNLNDYKGMAFALEKLVTFYPKRSYWVQLAAVYGELKRDKRSMICLELAYIQGLLSESQKLNLARQLIHSGAPYKSGKLMQAALDSGDIKTDFKNVKLLANSWMHARELAKAVPPMTQAAKLAKDGKIYAQLAELEVSRGNWAKAAAALNQALKKGGLRDVGNTYLLMGIAHYNAKKYSPAATAFNKAMKHRHTKELAGNWLRIMEAEQARKQALIDAREAAAKREAEKAGKTPPGSPEEEGEPS